jgi:hypothetical protein
MKLRRNNGRLPVPLERLRQRFQQKGQKRGHH